MLLPPAIAQRIVALRANADGGPRKINRLLVLPAADVGTAPFPALSNGEGALVDQAAIVMLPDVEALLAHDLDNPIGSSERGLLVGDPDLLKDKQWKFQPLPGARDEVLAINRYLTTTVLTGAEATRSTVLEQLSQRPTFIYFATHGIADPVNPMDGSFLALAAGHLYARDIKKLKSAFERDITKPTVVMSACQTGLGKVFEGGIFGLARAWHYAGAWQVVMSLWNVDDRATTILMSKMTSYHFGGREPQSGERDALLSLGASTEDRTGSSPTGLEFDLRAAMLAARLEYSDPKLWASFALYGLPTIQD